VESQARNIAERDLSSLYARRSAAEETSEPIGRSIVISAITILMIDLVQPSVIRNPDLVH